MAQQAPAGDIIAQAAPRHVAIIMDGNTRWAKRKHLPVAAGYRAGAKNVRIIARTCADAGVRHLTLFAFSTENWQRPRREVNLLMELMRNFLQSDLRELDEHQVRLRIIGDRTPFCLGSADADEAGRIDDARQ